MVENPLMSNDELIELYCSKTGLPQSSYHEMIYTWERINETLNSLNDTLTEDANIQTEQA
jgi:hypothetical protein